MTHPDTLTIPRAVVEQALAALMPHKSTVLRIYTAEDAAIDALRAALRPQAAAKKGLFIDMIAEHPGLAEELKAMDVAEPYKTLLDETGSVVVDTWGSQDAAEPVAYMDADGNFSDNNDYGTFNIPLYTTPPATQAEPVNEWTMIAPDGTRFTGPTPLKAAMPASKYRLEIDPVAAERFMAVVEQERQAGERENLECMAKYGTLDCPYCGGSGHIGDVMSVGGIVACSYPSCGCTGEGEPCRAEAQNDQLLSTPPATQAALTAALEALYESKEAIENAYTQDWRVGGYLSPEAGVRHSAAIAQIEALKGPTP